MSYEIKLTDAKTLNDRDGTWLCLLVDKPQIAYQFESEMKDKPYIAELKEYRERRSLDANSYCWVLIDKIAEVTGQNKTDIYRHCIKEIGGNSETVCVKENAAEKLIESWGKDKVGWIAESLESSKIEGCVNVKLYYGSSTFDTKQMSRLIDSVVQEAEQLEIETKTPEEIERLKSLWEEEQC